MNTQAQSIEALRAQAEAARAALVAAEQAAAEAEAAAKKQAEAEARALRDAEAMERAKKANAARIERVTKITQQVFKTLNWLSSVNGEDDYLTKRGYRIELYGDDGLAFGLVNKHGNRDFLGKIVVNDTTRMNRVQIGDKNYAERKAGSYNFDAIADHIRQMAVNIIGHQEKLSRANTNGAVCDRILADAKIAKHHSPIRADYYRDGYGRQGGSTIVAREGNLFVKCCIEVSHEQAEKLVQAMIDIGILAPKAD